MINNSPLIAAFAIGISCGIGCSPIIGFFLTSYVMGFNKNMKAALKTALSFSMGKIFATMLIGMAASLLGNYFIDHFKLLNKNSVSIMVNVIFILTGLYIAFKSYRTNKNKSHKCENCSNKSLELSLFKGKTVLFLFLLGIIYGITPCAPLINVVLILALLPFWLALLVVFVFAVSSTIFPILTICLISGFFSDKLYREIPNYIYIFQIATALILVIIGIIGTISIV